MKYTPKNIVEEGIAFTIPLYQRLFEWNTENVKQLLDDLRSAYEKKESSFDTPEEGDYYIGMLTSTTNSQSGKRLLLVDGQQRFTVMTLLACVLQCYTANTWCHFLAIDDKPRLSFVSRKSDDMYLMKLIKKDFDYDGELVNYNMKEGINTIRNYMEKYDGDKEKFANYIFTHLSFFISELPSNYGAQDLNKYFERMNSSGKNLEHHEILKVKLLSKLDGDISLYMQLWNKIADVDTVLLRKRENETESDFNNRKNSVINARTENILENPYLINNLKRENSGDSNHESIKDIGKREKKPQDSSNHQSNGSRSILRFPQLLLQTLYLFFKQKKQEDFTPRLDDFFNQNKLLETFQKYLPYEGSNVDKAKLKDFFELLLHCRVVMDVCFIRSLEYGYSLDMNLSEDNDDVKELLMFESFLYVSSTNVTNYRWFGWLMNYVFEKKEIPTPKELFNELASECDKSNKLPKYERLCFGEEIRYWFWRLDFYIWQHRKELFSSKEDSQYLNIVENYVFIRNRSIEHIAPQHPKTESKVQWKEDGSDTELLNCFGNLVMISQNLNSALSNSSYEEKKAHVESYFNSVNGTIESLKLLMVYKDCQNGWNKDCIEKHGKKMYSYLIKGCRITDD